MAFPASLRHAGSEEFQQSSVPDFRCLSSECARHFTVKAHSHSPPFLTGRDTKERQLRPGCHTLCRSLCCPQSLGTRSLLIKPLRNDQCAAELSLPSYSQDARTSPPPNGNYPSILRSFSLGSAVTLACFTRRMQMRQDYAHT